MRGQNMDIFSTVLWRPLSIFESGFVTLQFLILHFIQGLWWT